MQQVVPFSDERLDAYCFLCSATTPETRDHVPPKVFMDRPYPQNLPVVGCCTACNGGASLDEEYVACLLEVAACGSPRPYDLERPKIIDILTRKPALAERMTAAFRPDGVSAEVDRVERVLCKIGCALWRYEMAELGSVHDVRFEPLAHLQPERREGFLRINSDLLPEVGSRLMTKTLVAEAPFIPAWQDVQPERFAYAIETAGRGCVKMILRGYLAAEVTFR